MKKFHKFFAVAMASVMVLGLASCGPTESTTTTSEAGPVETTTEGSVEETTAAPSETTTDAEVSEPEETTTEEGTEPAGEVTTLKWVAVGGQQPDNYDAWKANLDEYMKDKIGVAIEKEIIPWGDWDNRRSVLVATSQDWDIMFTNGGTFYNDVQINAFADITDILPTAAPELYDMIPEGYWEAAKINGKIYAVPTYKDSSQTEYTVWDVAVAEAAGVDPNSVTDWATLEPALKAITEHLGEPAFPLESGGATFLAMTYDPLGIGDTAAGVLYNDEEAKVVSIFEQPEIMDGLVHLHRFMNEGYINDDAVALAEAPSYKPVSIAQGWSKAADTVWGPQMGVEAVAVQFGPTVVSNETVRGSLNAISSGTAEPEKALAFLELVNTDTFVRDAFYYGLEGDNFEYTADKKVHKLNTDWPMAGYTQGTFFNVSPLETQDFDYWDEVEELNEKAEPSVLLGFTYDPANVTNEIANMQEIVKRHNSELLTGTVNPEEAVPQMMGELRDAGFDKIVEDMQAQVDEFMANR